MPILTPPSEYEEPKPETPTVNSRNTYSPAELAKFEDFKTAKPWVCPKCGLTNHGWNQKCADWRCKVAKPI